MFFGGLSPVVAQERPSAAAKSQKEAKADDPFPRDGGPADMCRWLDRQYRLLNDRARRQQMEEWERYARATGQTWNNGCCSGGGVVERYPEVLSPAQWARFASRCTEALESGTAAEAIEAFQAINGYFEPALQQRPDLAPAFPAELNQAIIGRLEDGDVLVRRAAGWSLRRLGPGLTPTPPTMVPLLLTVLKDPDAQVRLRAVNALCEVATGTEGRGGTLGTYGPQAVTALLHHVEDPDRQVASWSMTTIGYLGEAGSAAVPRLIALLSSPDLRLERSASRALGSLGPIAAAAVPVLIEKLRHGDAEAQDRAARTLGRISEPAARAVPDLISALSHPTPEVTYAAASALGQLGPLAAEALPILMDALEKDPEAFGGEADWAVKRITGVE